MRCSCSHLEALHAFGVRAGKQVRTSCSASTCDCTRFDPVESEDRCPTCGAQFSVFEQMRRSGDG